jgi:hypothetical protein
MTMPLLVEAMEVMAYRELTELQEPFRLSLMAGLFVLMVTVYCHNAHRK